MRPLIRREFENIRVGDACVVLAAVVDVANSAANDVEARAVAPVPPPPVVAINRLAAIDE